MKCPFCGGDTKVVDTRASEDNSTIRRRRACEKCKRRFTTFEKIETIPLLVIKKDQSREEYDRDKIEAGLLRSCHKRPVTNQQMQKMMEDIETQIYSLGSKEILTRDIGEIVLETLKGVDEVAYVRFASVYREFEDVGTFMEEIGKLSKREEEC